MVSLSPPPPGPRRLITNPALFQPDYIIRARILQVTSFSFSFLTINDKFIILIEFQFARIYETPIILTNPGIFRAYEKFDTKTVTRGYTSSIDTDLIIFASQPPLAADCRIKRAAMTVSITSHCTPVSRLASLIAIFTSEPEGVDERRRSWRRSRQGGEIATDWLEHRCRVCRMDSNYAVLFAKHSLGRDRFISAWLGHPLAAVRYAILIRRLTPPILSLCFVRFGVFVHSRFSVFREWCFPFFVARQRCVGPRLYRVCG